MGKKNYDPKIEQEILDFVQAQGGNVSSADIVAGTGHDKKVLRRYLTPMVEAGKLTSEGQRRWTRYSTGVGKTLVEVMADIPEEEIPVPPPIDPEEADAEDEGTSSELDEILDIEVESDIDWPLQEAKASSEATTSAELMEVLGDISDDDPDEDLHDARAVALSALPRLEGEYDATGLAEAILELVPESQVHVLQVRRLIGELLRLGMLKIRQEYDPDRGFTFYYRAA